MLTLLLGSDHLPLWKFLEQNSLNLKVNRWAIEISSYHIDFQDIKGIKNTLADTMSQLIEIDPETELDAKPYGYEYGCYMFEDPSNLQAVSVSVNEIVEESKVPSQSENTDNRQDQALLLTKIEE